MRDDLVLEQFHLDILVPRRLRAQKSAAMRRTLAGPRFRARLLRAVRALLGRYKSLHEAAVDLSV
jgi:hypothetical protein